MSGILRGAMAGLGKGMVENAKVQMAEESTLRTKRALMEMEEQVRADREAAIQARRSKVLGETSDPGEIQRKGVELGDEGLASYGRQGVTDKRDADQYEDKRKDRKEDVEYRDRSLEVTERTRRDTNALGWANHELAKSKAGDIEAKRKLIGDYMLAVEDGDEDAAKALRREGLAQGFDVSNPDGKSRGGSTGGGADDMKPIDIMRVVTDMSRQIRDLRQISSNVMTDAGERKRANEEIQILEAEKRRWLGLLPKQPEAQEEPVRSPPANRRPLAEIIK